ncbi:MAG: 4-hydroxythreonine-4-phosphate dehydrogenase, partial [Alphaproteobacteria bacterium]|nr:4-hydroxythreonine-4-phosphate dehydrogenase [Alphaproteobacteria bacterium]
MILSLTMGEPAGIGGEIACKSWMRRDSGVPPFFLIDDADRIAALAAGLGWAVPVARVERPDQAAA